MGDGVGEEDELPEGSIVTSFSEEEELPEGSIVTSFSEEDELPEGSIVTSFSEEDELPEGSIVTSFSEEEELPEGSIVTGFSEEGLREKFILAIKTSNKPSDPSSGTRAVRTQKGVQEEEELTAHHPPPPPPRLRPLQPEERGGRLQLHQEGAPGAVLRPQDGEDADVLLDRAVPGGPEHHVRGRRALQPAGGALRLPV